MRHTDYRRFACLTTAWWRRRLPVLDRDVPAHLDVVRLRRHPGDPLPGLALEAGEVEIGLYHPVLVYDLVGDDDQVVRVEVAADVGIGQEPLVRRIADALEAVELEALDRIHVAELVDEENPAARAGDARE